MSTFSGTNLPPIVRLGGTGDAPISLERGTRFSVAPGHIRRTSTVQTNAVSLPTIVNGPESPFEEGPDAPLAEPKSQEKRN